MRGEHGGGILRSNDKTQGPAWAGYGSFGCFGVITHLGVQSDIRSGGGFEN